MNMVADRIRDRHRGERCVIMGNGPSLRRIDLSLLKGEITFGLNKIFLLIPEMGWAPTYYCAVNPLVIEQARRDILDSGMPKFIGHEGVNWIPARDDVYFLNSKRREAGFATTLDEPMWQGYTVTYCALQLAYIMGFSEVVLVGVDHCYRCAGAPNQEQDAEAVDVNHFHPGYFSSGQKWNLPDLDMSETAYAMAREAFESDGRRVVNATPGTCLDVFDKVELEAVLNRAGKRS